MMKTKPRQLCTCRSGVAAGQQLSTGAPRWFGVRFGPICLLSGRLLDGTENPMGCARKQLRSTCKKQTLQICSIPYTSASKGYFVIPGLWKQPVCF